MKPEAVRDEKARFNSVGGPTVCVGQIGAAGEAHTLSGHPDHPCFSSIFLENSYQLMKRKQAEGRNHRGNMDGEQPVTYYDPVSSPAEFDITRALQRKRDLVDAVINGAWRRQNVSY